MYYFKLYYNYTTTIILTMNFQYSNNISHYHTFVVLLVTIDITELQCPVTLLLLQFLADVLLVKAHALDIFTFGTNFLKEVSEGRGCNPINIDNIDCFHEFEDVLDSSTVAAWTDEEATGGAGDGGTDTSAIETWRLGLQGKVFYYCVAAIAKVAKHCLDSLTRNVDQV